MWDCNNGQWAIGNRQWAIGNRQWAIDPNLEGFFKLFLI
jgi:hypothetical protein